MHDLLRKLNQRVSFNKRDPSVLQKTLAEMGAETAQPSHAVQRQRSRLPLDDYQRLVVNRIKHHFEKRRRQWEKKLQAQVETISSQKSPAGQPPLGRVLRINSVDDVIDDDDVEIENADNLDNVDNAQQLTELQQQDNNDHLPLHVTSFKTYKDGSGNHRHFLKVDITPFVPDGTVTVRTEDNGITIVGDNLCAKCTLTKSQKKRNHVVTKFVSLPDRVDPSRIHVQPQQGGFLFIDVTTVPLK